MLDLPEHLENQHTSPTPATPPEQNIGICSVLGVPVAAGTVDAIIAQVNKWIDTSDRSHFVTFTNVHMVVEAQLRPRFRSILERMDLNCPDGAPVFWLTRRQQRAAQKISGPDFMPAFCKQSVALGHRHFFYGGAEGVAAQAAAALSASYPGLNIAGHYTPPFRDLSEEEADQIVNQINASGADIIWVSLGCPRQEWWLHEFGPRLNARVLLAVGQATDIIAGTRSRAPSAMSRFGLEWLYRLSREPGRLWKRYLVTNSLFLLLLAREKLLPRVAEAQNRLAQDIDTSDASLLAPRQTHPY